MISDQQDITYINSLGISKEEVERQLLLLRKGVVYPQLIKPAIVGDGIAVLSEAEESHYAELFQQEQQEFDCIRFIPASGAATRMFSFLQEWLINDISSEAVVKFFENYSRFPFAPMVTETDRKVLVAKLLLEETKFLNFPKALIPFHKNDGKLLTAFESQLDESSYYSFSKTGECQTHFTISEEHHPSFLQASATLELETNGRKHDISFSFQGPETNTVSLDDTGAILRNEKGEIILRQGGHGSLLKNLQGLDQDIIFIRNIDNVVSPSANSNYVRMHQIMGGMMIEALSVIYSLQRSLDEKNKPTQEQISYLEKYWRYDGNNSPQKLREFLFRPIRICGMVRNQGEPGGGPFWIIEKDGTSSLQIIESSQVNATDPKQMTIFKSSSHFNPVDICCSIRNYRGEKYDLQKFSNPDLSFVSSKVIGGKTCTVLEHPGLWNGSMHHWLTVFIELPSDLFNPVKTVNDLLRPAHQK